LWCTVEFGYLRLADGFVQGSSIMPQKRNPVALEHARAIASKAVGQAAGLMMAAHNTPFGDIVDSEDDLPPLGGPWLQAAARGVAARHPRAPARGRRTAQGRRRISLSPNHTSTAAATPKTASTISSRSAKRTENQDARGNRPVDRDRWTRRFGHRTAQASQGQ